MKKMNKKNVILLIGVLFISGGAYYNYGMFHRTESQASELTLANLEALALDPSMDAPDGLITCNDKKPGIAESI